MGINEISSAGAVIQAIEEYDKLGSRLFLDKYGFGKAKIYCLKYKDKLYPSKAILGVAYKFQFPEKGALRAFEFVGGLQNVVKRLEALGFEIKILK
jgi:5-methylcytosine-specific restriction protein A